MFQNKRKTIGVMICDIASDYQDRLCQRISTRGNELGYNVAFFVCFTIYGAHNENATGEYNIIYLPPYESLDALIICPDTYFDDDQVDRVREQLAECSCPIICIRRQLDDYYSVLINDTGAIEKIVHHFATVHKFTRLGFMSGPAKHSDSIARFESFKKALDNEGLTFYEEYLFEGDFWRNKGQEAAVYYTEKVSKMPEAIVCANDYMAISLCMELVLKGYLVPDDIAISGFDNILEATNNMPPLTTLSVSVNEMADKAIHMIEQLHNNETIEKIQYVETEPIIRNSCGCSTFDMQTMVLTRVKQIAEFDQVIKQTLNNTFTSISLEGLENCLSIGSYLHLLDYEDNHIRNFFLCLGETTRGTVYPKYRLARSGYAKNSYSIYSILDRKEIETSVFKTAELIPPEGRQDEPVSYFFFALHHLAYTFGYLAISYHLPYSCDKTFNNWVSIISNSLENVYVSNERNRLLDELNNLYVHDSLTGLYNRRGFEQHSIDIFNTNMRTDQMVMILGVDMDNLKTVNDKFGHLHGDLALKTIADALIHASVHNEVCARVGGDEYNVIGSDYNEEKLEEFIKRLYEYLRNFNENSEYMYTVDVSYGAALVTAKDNMNLEECINLSDKRLYEQKRAKKKKKGDVVR